MTWSIKSIVFLASVLHLGDVVSGAATWPSSYDELEDIMGMAEATTLIDPN